MFQIKKSKSFNLKVVPKLTVNYDVQDYIVRSNPVVEGTIDGMYANGQYLDGEALIIIKEGYNFNYYHYDIESFEYQETFKVLEKSKF